MNEEMASAKMQALRLKEWRPAIDSENLSQLINVKRIRGVRRLPTWNGSLGMSPKDGEEETNG
jgi:hypothetical protein